MQQDFNNLFETYRGNMFPGMWDLLSQEVSIPVEHLKRLGIGYRPEYGAWVFPERDAYGDVIGLVCRGHTAMKYTVKGSKRGLTYPVNPTGKRYIAGSHGWTRCTPQLICPICEREKWCAISDDDPKDPSVVLCTKMQRGSHHSVTTGHIHIMHNRGGTGGGSLLPASEYPVLVVEGATDVLAAMTMGFVAVGRFTALGGVELLCDLLRNRNIICLGENDPDGIKGMEKMFLNLKPGSEHAVKCLPPSEYKDLRKWWIGEGLTADDFMKYITENSSTEFSTEVLPDDTGLTIAKAYIQQECTMDGMSTLRHYKTSPVQYIDSRYEILDSGSLRGRLYRFLDGKKYIDKAPNGAMSTEDFKLTRNKISDVVDAIYAWHPITEDPPLWLEGRDKLPDPANLIPFANGILDVEEYFKGHTVLLKPTPNFFTFSALPYDFDPNSHSPMWEEYLREIFDEDEEKISLLQQWFGYNLVPDMSYEKLMFFVGRPRSGKGTVLSALAAMLGHNQVCSTSWASLSTRFAYHPLIGKLAAILPDAKDPPTRAAAGLALERILQITGGDPVGVDRKNKDYLAQIILFCRFTMAMNNLPDLADHAQALEPRLNLINFSNSYVGKEKRWLKRRIKNEALRIIPWALEGLRKLREDTVFVEPSTSVEIIHELRNLTNPVFAFAQECCHHGKKTDYVQTDILFEVWKKWCIERGVRYGLRQKFGMRLSAVCPNVKKARKRIAGRNTYVYGGLSLTDFVEKEYLERPE